MTESVGQIGLDLVLNQRPFERQMGGIQGIAGNWAGKLGKLVGGALTVGAITSFAKSCLSLGSDLSEVQNVVDVTFGSMSEDVNNWAKKAINSFGLSEKCAKDYIGTLGTMSKAFGFSADAAYKQATALTGLSADVASFRNLSNDEAFTKLQAVYTGETEALKSLGVVMTQTALDQYALAHGYSKTTAAMTEMEKVELRLAFVTDALSDASGDFARTSGSWANQIKILSVNFNAVKASLGQGLINVLTPALRMLNELVARLQSAADAFRDFTAAVFGDAGGAASTEKTAHAAGELASNTESAVSAAKDYKKAVIGIDSLNKLGDASDGGTAVASDNGSSMVSSEDTENAEKTNTLLNDIKAKLKSIAKLTGIDALWKSFRKGFDRINLSGIKKNFEDIFGGISDIVSGCFGSAQDFIQSFMSWVGSNWGRFAEIIGGGIEAASGFISSFITNNKDEITQFFNDIFNGGAEFFNSLNGIIGGFFASVAEWWNTNGVPIWNDIMGVFRDIGMIAVEVFTNTLIPIFDSVKNSVSALWEETLQPFWNNMLSHMSNLWENLLSLWNTTLKPLVSWIVQNVAPSIKRAVDIVVSVIGTVIETVTGVVSGIWKSLGGLLDFVAGVFAGDWNKAWQGICDYFGGAWDGIWSLIKGVINLIIDAVNKLWTGIFSVIQGICNGIGSIVVAIGDFFGADWSWSDFNVNVPTIQPLANGGYVAANTPQLALIGDNKHEGEIVAPESKIAEAVAAGISAAMSQLNTAGGDIRVVVELDGEILGEAVAARERRELVRGNGS